MIVDRDNLAFMCWALRHWEGGRFENDAEREEAYQAWACDEDAAAECYADAAALIARQHEWLRVPSDEDILEWWNDIRADRADGDEIPDRIRALLTEAT